MSGLQRLSQQKYFIGILWWRRWICRKRAVSIQIQIQYLEVTPFQESALRSLNCRSCSQIEAQRWWLGTGRMRHIVAVFVDEWITIDWSHSAIQPGNSQLKRTSAESIPNESQTVPVKSMNATMKWNASVGPDSVFVDVFLLRVWQCRHSLTGASLWKAIKTSSASTLPQFAKGLLDKWCLDEGIRGKYKMASPNHATACDTDLTSIISNLNGYNLSLIQSLCHGGSAPASQRWRSVPRGHCTN